MDGTPSAVTVGTSGTVALLRFSGAKGQRLSLGLTGSTFGTELAIVGFSPYGGSFARDEFDSAFLLSNLYGGLALPPLPSSGTYQIVLDPAGTGTGSVTATLSSRVPGALSVTGSGTQVSLGRAGQQAELTFDVTAGQYVSLGFTGSTFASGSLTAEVREPNGTPLLWGTTQATRTTVSLQGGNLDLRVTQTGTYRVMFGSSDAGTGAVTVTASTSLDAGMLALGTPMTVAISRAGQDARMSFAGTVGQRLTLDFTAYSFPYAPFVDVLNPDGTLLSSGNLSNQRLDLPDLPATGAYTIRVSPYSSTGSFTARLVQRLNAGSITVTGASVAVSLSQPGQGADLTFSATSGQRLSFGFTGWTFPAAAVVRAQVLDPSGVVVVARRIGSLGSFWFTPATSGSFRLVLAPEDSSTGAVTVTLAQEVAGGALTIGAAKSVTSSRIGQTTRLTFTGAVNQRLSLRFGSYTYPNYFGVQILKPDGTVLRDGVLTELQLDLDPLPAAGTYQVVVYPYAETGSTQLTLAERVDAGTVTVGGAAKALTVASAGRYVETSFTATAGQRLSLGFTSWTFGSARLRVRMLSAQSQTIFDTTIAEGGSVEATTGAAGTYRIVVGADDLRAGSATLTLSEQINGGAISLNTAKTVTANRAGQSTRFTYAGTAGQTLAIRYGTGTMPYYPFVVLRSPTGAILADLAGASTVNLPALPSSGTYEITIGPYSFTGTMGATLVTRTAKAAQAFDGLDKQTPSLPRPSATSTRLGGDPANPHLGLREEVRLPAGKPGPQSATTGMPGTGTSTPATAGAQGEGWTPDRANLDGTDWYAHRAAPEAPAPPVLRAPAGATALTGRVLTLDGKPLPKVTVSIDKVRSATDERGQFLLTGLPAGHRVLRVDGASASSPGRVFGLHDIGVDLAAGQTTELSYSIWLTKLDTAHTVRFASPTDKEVSITTPAVPGLEVRLPAGAVIRDVNGKVVTELGITAIPVDRAPFPLPRSQVPSYFTVQPGSAYVFPAGARVIYPNFFKAKPGAVMDFWHYDPADKGWFVYGHGTVTPDGKRVEPDKGTEVYQFTGAMLITPGQDPPPAVAPVPGGGARGADPVDLGTGLFLDEHTDMTVDDVVPLAVRRTYQQSDTGRRSFGIGVNSDYDINLYSTNRFVDCWLLLPDGGRVRYHRITPGSTGPRDFLNAAFEADPTPTAFSGSILAWNGDGWDLRLRDGTTYVFGDEAPLQAIRDRYGNIVTVSRAPAPADGDGFVRARGPITQVTSPNGKWIKFSYDSANRITRAEDTIGRAVAYTYTTAGNLETVTDVNGGVTTYTYEAGKLKTIKDPRNTVFLTNAYDANGRVQTQTMPGGATYQLAYTTDGSGRVTETRLTDPNGHVRRVTFNSAGFTTSDTAAYGTPDAQTLQITRHSTTNLPTAYVDALNRRTELGYDTYGNPTTVTELAGTSNARTTTTVYGGPFDQVSTATDPLNHSTGYGYQTDGSLRTVTDALSRVTTFDTNEAGQVIKVTDNATRATTLGYTLGDLTTVTDPLGRVTRTSYDTTSRPVSTIDAQGNTSRVTYDNAGQVKTVTDPIGRLTSYEYDPNGNLTRSVDPRTHATNYGYDASDRLETVTDPLNRVTTRTYDPGGNLKTVTTARGKVTGYDYDSLDRPTTVRYGVTGPSSQESTTTYTYDAGNRTRTVVDSAGGTTTLTPDLLDRTTRAVTGQGQVDYTYDPVDRRATMTVAGQPETVYGYNNADQLTSIIRGSETVGIGYDNVGRRKTLTLPAGVTQTYGYDNAGQLTSLIYARGATTLGNLTYDYDPAGRPIHVGGSYARADIPAAYGPATYDNANQLVTNGVTAHTYDTDGNLTSDGTATYTWNARNQLTQYAKPGLTVSYGYDGLGRRANRDNTTFLYDGLNTVQEQTGSTPTANLLTGGLDETFSRTTSIESRSLLTDALGSTLSLADTTTLGAEYTYQPFGATTVTGDDAGNTTRFTGREDDPSGLYYYRNRYYSPTSGRFISQDPLGLASGDTNPYAYVFNQPTSLVDPMGTKPQGSGDCGTPNSFTAGTQVLMADGTTKPIEQITLGDQVHAADPETGDAGARTVTALIQGDGDKHLIDITLQPDNGENDNAETPTATDGHPFWTDDDGNPNTPGGRWIDAVELRHGQWLKTADGHLVQVAGTHAYTQQSTVYNLTVDDLHTYYVIAGGQSVLVHNTEPCVQDDGNRYDDPLHWHAEGDPQEWIPMKIWARTGGNLKSGEYHYVVMPNRSVRAFHTRDIIGDIDLWIDGIAPYAGHTSLSRGSPVIMAGLFDANANGVITRFDNRSGHYKPRFNPHNSALEQIARDALLRNGFSAASALWDPRRWR
ncbi:RHS repeat-associated core domain-containing protein [Micromonospora sp. NPDC049102]|uniref:RHS repeat-associated core domain-containing protein n=1 Tax=Micromonospora sp. NPDC049102 TaxID=3364265 RepID=UPI0037229C20